MVLATLTACAALALIAQAAPASHVQCGDVITADTRLDSDLQCSFAPEEGRALTIAASGVTLDLGGHSVTGPPFFSDTVGIAATGVDRAVVRNGSVRSFSSDISLQQVTESLVRDIRAASISVSGDRNTVQGNSEASGIGVIGDHNEITHNAISSGFSFDDRRWMAVSGTDNLITRNVLTNVSPSSASTFAVGMLLRLHGGLVANNVITAAPNGPAAGDGLTGMDLSGERARVRRNVASGHVDGFRVGGPFVLTQNRAFSNVDDGFDVWVSGAMLTRNEANDNGDLGIEAVPATIDGGGNRASGNGNPTQCVGVTCR